MPQNQLGRCWTGRTLPASTSLTTSLHRFLLARKRYGSGVSLAPQAAQFVASAAASELHSPAAIPSRASTRPSADAAPPTRRAQTNPSMPSPDPVTDSSHTTPFSTPLPSQDDQLLSPLSTAAATGLDPLVEDAAKKLAAVINSFKRELDERDGLSAAALGAIEIVVDSDPHRSYKLSVVHDVEGEEHPISVRVTHKKDPPTPNGQPIAKSSALLPPTPSYKPTRRSSDAALEQDILPRRKRKAADDDLVDGVSLESKRIRMGDEDEDIMPLISKEDLEDLLAKQREDIQEDTADCINHVQRLLRKWREQWHEKSSWEYDTLTKLEHGGGAGDKSAVDGTRSGTRPSVSDVFAVPTPQKDPISGIVNIPDLVRKEAKQLSNQIRWVEQCRRIASEAHDAREETWRMSSASFHDKNRQSRESFEQRMLNESAIQGTMLSQILSEVKGLASVAFSLKWETPSQYSAPVPSQSRPGHGSTPTQRPPQAPPQHAGRRP
ncbi:uncharacterized protein BDZ99DRAFT_494911 [Mytilinidion resinicola]|uniref:Uncharacterized protein n=1 Tax=Mytilinidion resinicola TaxID=574789 RepID=A0A6A6Z2Z6_9PEZI|nr:uncharacterized protein BDZ99DRAFT_494911 [Mytilinidion resinicola]KAF2815053.1 hypothetical protein BDZ99DRAFT_494911 [Mytilinidion resinicola]